MRRLRLPDVRPGDLQMPDLSPTLLGVAGVVAGVLLVLLLVFSGGGESTPDSATSLVPREALVYVHVDLDRDSKQYEDAARIAKRFPSAQVLLRALANRLRGPGGRRFDFDRDIRPWVGAEAGLAILPRGRHGADSVFLLEVGDKARANRFLRGLGRHYRRARHGKADLRIYGRDFVSALVGDFLAIGQRGPVERTIDVERGKAKGLRDLPAAERARKGLPGARLADVYASRDGVRTVLGALRGIPGQIGAFANHPALEAAAAAVVAGKDGLQIRFRRALDRKRNRKLRTFGAFPAFKPSLAGQLPERTFAYIGAANLDMTLDRLLGQAIATVPGFSRSFERFRRGLGRRGQVDIQKQLLPLLQGEAAFAVAPGTPAPVITIVVKGVDERKARRVLAELQGPIASAITPGARQNAPSFRERRIGDANVFSIRLIPTIDLTYAVFDHKLVVTTDPLGIQRIQKQRKDLGGRDLYREVLRDAPQKVSTLVFLDLEQFIGQAEGAGLGADPAYALIRQDIRRLKALGATSTSRDDETQIDLSLAIR